jgi:membrane protein YqaA with SNARE-associated domain
MLIRRERVWTYALVATVGCTAGALVGYGIGFYLFDQWGVRLIETAGWQEAYATFERYFDAYGFWPIVAVGVAPIPFQVAMLVAGAAGYELVLFVLAATLARALRYFGLGLLVKLLGDKAVQWWQRNKTATGIAALAFVGALFALFRWLEHVL